MTKRRGLAGVNEAMFDELDRLDALDISDADAVAAEVQRARAVRDVAATIIGNGRLVLDLARADADTAGAVKIPKGLLG